MRILYVSHNYTPHDHRFLSSLAGSGQEVFWLRLQKGSRVTEARPLSGRVNPVPWNRTRERITWVEMFIGSSAFQKMAQEIQPDLVHAGPIQTAAFLVALAEVRPLVSMSWGSDLLLDSLHNPLQRWIASYVLRRSTLLMGDCQAVANRAEALGMPGERIVLFPWGIDLEKFFPHSEKSLRQSLGWQECFVLLSLRTWEPLYGVDVTARAFGMAAQKNPSLRLILAGSGSQEPAIRRILSEAGVTDRVYFSGQVNQADLVAYYHAADLYLSASHSDGSSVSLMEALACGLPVLVSDIAGNREWIDPGKQGWLFKDGRVEEMAQGILQAVAGRRRLREMGAMGRQRAEERADWKKNFQKMLDGYDLARRLNEQTT